MPEARSVVLVTGASTGIGAATANLFATRGEHVVVATMRQPDVVAGLHPDAVRMRLDVTDQLTIDDAVAEVLTRFGRIDILVNNAGYGLIGPLESLGIDQLRRQFDTNLLGLVAVTKAALPHMRAAGRGTIVNVSSIGGRMAFPFSSAYHATKWAVEGLSDSVRHELRPFGIRVKLVEPGGIRTDFGTRSMDLTVGAPYEPMTRRMLDMYRKRNDRLPGPAKVAETIMRAATDRSDRLRYPVHHQPYALLHAWLPDRAWRRMVGSVVGEPATQS